MTKLHRLLCVHSWAAMLALVAFPSFNFAQMAQRPPANMGMMGRPNMPQMNPGMMPQGTGMPQMNPAMPQMGYGMGGAGTYSYGAGAANGYGSGMGAAGYATEHQPSPEEKRMSRLLTASGVPNDNGHLRWPVGLRVLAAPGADELRDQLDAIFQETAYQATNGPVNAALAFEARQAVAKFRRMVQKERTEHFVLAPAIYDESERFLAKLDRAEQVLRGGLNPPARETQMTTPDQAPPGTPSPRGPEAYPETPPQPKAK